MKEALHLIQAECENCVLRYTCLKKKRIIADASAPTKKLKNAEFLSVYAITSDLLLSTFPWEYTLIAGILLDFDKEILAFTG